MSRNSIMLVAGEPSGDALGGGLMAALDAVGGGAFRYLGVGGPAMGAEGLSSLFAMEELSVMGFAEIVPRLPRLLRRLDEVVALARAERPVALVTIDSPGFNLRLARRLAGQGMPLIHYVAPQVWAWRPGRARRMAAYLDHVLALLPFEPPFFERHGLPCTYVGHPAVESSLASGDGVGFRARHGIPETAPVLLVLPGSRVSEVTRHLPIFAATLDAVAATVPDLRLVSVTLRAVSPLVREASATWPVPTVVVEGENEKSAAFAAAQAALAASGTVTLELALAGVPMVVAYAANPATAWLARRLVRVPYASLPNLVLARGLVPELLLEECRPESLVRALGEVMVDREKRDAQTRGFAEIATRLASPGTSPRHRAAKVVLQVIEQGPRRRISAPA